MRRDFAGAINILVFRGVEDQSRLDGGQAIGYTLVRYRRSSFAGLLGLRLIGRTRLRRSGGAIHVVKAVFGNPRRSDCDSAVDGRPWRPPGNSAGGSPPPRRARANCRSRVVFKTSARASRRRINIDVVGAVRVAQIAESNKRERLMCCPDFGRTYGAPAVAVEGRKQN